MDKRLHCIFVLYFDHSTEKCKVKKMKLANKQFSKSAQEEARKFETEILDLKGKRREEAINAYRRLLLSSADQLIYYTRS
jgi:hypothetical protein